MKNSLTCVFVRDASPRLDRRLAENFDRSRNFFEHLLRRAAIRVNGRPAKKSQVLRPGDLVAIESFERFLSSEILADAARIPIPIVHDHPDFLLLDKPKKVLSHPSSVRDLSTPSVVAFLFQHFAELPSTQNFIRAGLLHRLDRDTDGLLLVARSERGLQHFRRLFHAKSTAPTLAARDTVPLKKFYQAHTARTDAALDFLAQQRNFLAPASTATRPTFSLKFPPENSSPNFWNFSKLSPQNSAKKSSPHSPENSPKTFSKTFSTNFWNFHETPETSPETSPEIPAAEIIKNASANFWNFSKLSSQNFPALVAEPRPEPPSTFSSREEFLNFLSSNPPAKIFCPEPILIDAPVTPRTPAPTTRSAQTRVHAATIFPDKISRTLEILTGRTHQIRIHAAEQLGAPILGDFLYGQPADFPLQLRAARLIFLDPDGQLQDFSPPDSPDFVF